MTPGPPSAGSGPARLLADARAFRRSYYGRTVRPDDRRAPLTWASVPRDYAAQIRAVRRARGLSQAQLATLGGRGAQSRRLPMGGAKTHAVTAVLATNHRAPRARGQPLGAKRSNSRVPTLAPRGLHRKEMIEDLAARMIRIVGVRAADVEVDLLQRWIDGPGR